jgi:uncharacterized repeat protein (TIGR01451 family)
MFRKAIVSHLGEVTQDTRTIGDTVRYRIYYDNGTSSTADVVITDPLDKGLSQVKVFNEGQYDPAKHTITWRVKRTPPWLRTFVEFEAVIGPGALIRNQALLLGLGLHHTWSNVVETVVKSAPKLGWLPFAAGATAGESPRVAMKDETTSCTTVRFDLPGLYIYEEELDGVTYHHLRLAGRAGLREVGKPELPSIGEMIEVPSGVQFTPEILVGETVILENYNVYPAQRPRHVPPSKPEPLDLDRPCYLTDADYPAALVDAGDDRCAVIRGHRVLFLRVNPIRYNPVTRTLTVYTTLEVRLHYDQPAQLRGVERRIRSGAFEDLLQRATLNHKDPRRFVAPDMGVRDLPLGCDYLIITAGSLYNEHDPQTPVALLARWKRRKGYRTRVVKVEEIGADANAIRAFVKDAYDNWSPALTYLLLVGDADAVPPYPASPNPSSGPQINTDLYYGAVDGTDQFPEIYVGRLSAHDTQELAAIVTKILAYEQTPPQDAGFYQDVSLVTQFSDAGSNGHPGTEFYPWMTNMETLHDFLAASYNVERIYNTDSGYPENSAAPSPKYWQDGTELPNDLKNYAWPSVVAAGQMIKDALNAGRFLVVYLAHGDSDGWAGPGFREDKNYPDITKLEEMGVDPVTGQLTGPTGLPVIFSITCSSGSFDNEIYDTTADSHDCLGENFVKRARAGAVAFVGHTRESGIDDNSVLLFGLNKAIWPAYNPQPHWGTAQNPHPALPADAPPRLLRMGQIVTFGRAYYAKVYGLGGYQKAYLEMLHLLGDPEMPIWTQMPGRLNVDHPERLCEGGPNEFVVSVRDEATDLPVLGATAVITRGDAALQMQQTNAEGLARFQLQDVGSGDLDITVTAADFRPYMGQILVLAGSATLTLTPADGSAGQTMAQAQGQGFWDGEPVELRFGGQALPGPFAGPLDATFLVPQHDLGLANVMAYGKTSNHCAWAVFQVRGEIPLDLWTYDQSEPSTWPQDQDGPTWDSPDIQLYHQNQPVPSDGLTVGQTYTVKVAVYNNTPSKAEGVRVVFWWTDFGAGGPWQPFDDAQQPSMVDIGRSTSPNTPGKTVVETSYTPTRTGHLCIQAVIEHPEDTTPGNNAGQENLSVGPTSSPATFEFGVWNPGDEPAPVHLEVRQLIPAGQQGEAPLWATWIKHPDPQILRPGESGRAWVIVDPGVPGVAPGDEAHFAVTAFVGTTVIGGVNVTVTKR